MRRHSFLIYIALWLMTRMTGVIGSEGFAENMNIIHLRKRQEHNGESIMPFN